MNDDPFAAPDSDAKSDARPSWLGPRNALFIAGAVLGTVGILLSIPIFAGIGILCWVCAILLAYSHTLGITRAIEGFFED